MRILVVEDEPQLAKQLSTALAEHGYAVDLAYNGQDALHLGREEPFDAVILDLGLPVLDGLSVLKAWRRESVKVPVIVLTARDSWSEKVTGIDAGADDYMAKPFHMEELLARLRGVIRRSVGQVTPVLHWRGVALDTVAGRVWNQWGKTSVHVSSRPSGDGVELLIDDDGPGVDPGRYSDILHRGTRLDELTPGSGLGLAITSELVELYNGHIAFCRSPLQGLRVSLKLPITTLPALDLPSV